MTEKPSTLWLTLPSSGSTGQEKYEICVRHPLVQDAVFLYMYIFQCRSQQFWQVSYCVSQKAVLLRRHNTQCKKHFEHVASFSRKERWINIFLFDWKAFCVHTNTLIWNTMDTLAIKIVDMLVGTVYNKWGRCVSIKYSLLWYNHTKKIQWSVEEKHWFSSGCTIKINDEVYLVFILYYDYIQVDWWGICIQEDY